MRQSSLINNGLSISSLKGTYQACFIDMLTQYYFKHDIFVGVIFIHDAFFNQERVQYMFRTIDKCVRLFRHLSQPVPFLYCDWQHGIGRLSTTSRCPLASPPDTKAACGNLLLQLQRALEGVLVHWVNALGSSREMDFPNILHADHKPWHRVCSLHSEDLTVNARITSRWRARNGVPRPF